MVSDLNKKNWGSTNLAKERQGSADLHTPIHGPPHNFVDAKFEYKSPDLCQGDVVLER